MPTVGVFAAIFDAQGRILCVRQGSGSRRWTLPGGRMESGETPHGALVREVSEETGYVVTAGELIGVYSIPSKDALALSFHVHVAARNPWRPTDEIAEMGFFARDALPVPMRRHTILRVHDAFDGTLGILRTIGRKTAVRKLVKVS